MAELKDESPQAAEDLAKPKASTKENPVTDMMNDITDVDINLTETTLYRSAYAPDSFRAPYNADDLYRKAGNYTIYEKMAKDDQISVCLKLKKDVILGEGFNFVSGEDGQEDIIEDLERIFTDELEVPFLDLIEEMCDAYNVGFSLTEPTFKICDDGKLGLKSMKTRNPNTWLLHQDDHGNVSKYEQRTVQGDLDIPAKKLIHLVNNRKYQNPYGTSDLRVAYEAWFAKKQVIGFFAIFLEKTASSTPIAKYESSVPKPLVQKVFDIIKNLQTKTAMVIPKEFEVEFLESKNTGEAYTKAINLFNMFIGRALFTPDLLGFSGSETGGGSFSLGANQMAIWFMHIARRRATLEHLINKQLVRPCVIYNYGFQEKYPVFKFRPLDDSRAGDLAKIWLDAVKGKAFKPNDEEINHFRKLVKFPEGDVVQPDPPPPNPLMGQNPNDPNDPNVKQGEEQENPENLKDANGKDPKDQKEKKPTGKKEFKLGKFPVGDYHRKVNFKALQTKLNDYDQSVMAESAPVIKKIYADLFDQIERKRIVQTGNVSRLDSIKIKYLKELKQILKSNFMQLYKDAQTQASQELEKGHFAKPVLSDEFLEILEAEVYQFIGKFAYTITEKTKVELIAAIKDGKNLATVIDILDEDGKELSRVQLERFARTKHTEVMNKGRYEFFQKSDVVAAYQFSAILDDVTSDICSECDGKIFPADTTPIPPLHFNCRSTIVPITKYEDYAVSKEIGGMDPDKFLTENVGEGFSVQ